MNSRRFFRFQHETGSTDSIRAPRELGSSPAPRLVADRRLLFDRVCLIGMAAFLLVAGAVAVQAESSLPAWLEQCGPAVAMTQGEPAANPVDERMLQCDAPVNLQVLLTTTPIQAARKTPPAICVPAESETTLQTIAEIFHGYASQYQQTVYENPYVLLIESLEERYPCQQVGQPSPD